MKLINPLLRLIIAIKLQDVKDYLNSRDDKQTQFKHKKYNSCISPGVNYEYEVDLMFMSKNDEKIGLVAVDNFSKFAHIAVIKNKQPDETIRGLKVFFILKWGNQSNYTAMKRDHLMHLNILDFLMKIIPSIYRL